MTVVHTILSFHGFVSFYVVVLRVLPTRFTTARCQNYSTYLDVAPPVPGSTTTQNRHFAPPRSRQIKTKKQVSSIQPNPTPFSPSPAS